MPAKTFSQIIGWKKVRQAANAAIKIAESFTKYSVRGRTVQDRLENFSASIYMNATDWHAATAGLDWWQKNAVALGLSFHLFWCTSHEGDYFTLRMSKHNLISNIGNSPLACEFPTAYYMFEDGPPQDHEHFSVQRLRKETFHVPMVRYWLTKDMTYKDVCDTLLEDDIYILDDAYANGNIDAQAFMAGRDVYCIDTVYRLTKIAIGLVEYWYSQERSFSQIEMHIGQYLCQTCIIDGEHAQTCIHIDDTLGLMSGLLKHPKLTIFQENHGNSFYMLCDEWAVRALRQFITELLNQRTR